MTNPHANALLAVGRYLREHDYRFITVTPSTHRRINRRPGNERATDLRGIFGWSRPFAPGDVEPELLGLMREAGILEQDGALRIRLKRVDLVNCDAAFGNIQLFM